MRPTPKIIDADPALTIVARTSTPGRSINMLVSAANVTALADADVAPAANQG
jgi:hypothetical protein